MPNKFIETLSATDYNQLLENYQTSHNFRLRNRSHAILLSFQKYPIDEIAKICEVHRTTPNKWEIEVNSILGEGKLFPPNCEEFPSHVPLLFKDLQQLNSFIQSFDA